MKTDVQAVEIIRGIIAKQDARITEPEALVNTLRSCFGCLSIVSFVLRTRKVNTIR